MITQPTEPQSASRHPYSTGGLSLRLLLLGAMLTSLAVALTGGQPVGASSTDGREPASDSTVVADGGPAGGPGVTGQRAPAGGGAALGQASDGGPAGGDGPPGGIVPAASASPGGGSAGAPPDDWHLYHQWTDPSWPDPGQATGDGTDPGGEWPGGGAPLPARTAGGYNWDPPLTPTTEPTPPTGWTPTPGDPTDPAPGTPADPPTITEPAPDPAVPDEEPDSPAPSVSTDRPGGEQQDGVTGPAPATSDQSQRDPVAAGPDDDDDLGLGETVDEPTPTPTPGPTASAVAAPRRAVEADTTPASEYHQTLIYSGLVGLALAAIGLTMVGLRRRRW